MLEKHLSKFADLIMENETNPNIDKDIIVYGLNSAIEQGVGLLSILIIGYLFGLTLELIVFLISFKFIRTFAGGYHCKKNIHCFFVSNTIVVMILGVIKLLNTNYLSYLSLILLLISIPSLYKLAPVQTTYKPLDDIEIRHYKRKVRINLIIEVILAIVLFIQNSTIFAFVISMSIFISALAIIVELFRNNYRP